MKNKQIGSFLFIVGLLTLISCSKENPGPTPDPSKTYYHVIFDAKGGTPIPDEQIVEKYHRVNPPASPKKERAIYNGWKEKGSDKGYDFSTPVTHDLALEADFTNCYQVNFVTFGGTDFPSRLIKEGLTVSDPGIPTRELSKFEGWYYAGDIGGLIEFDFDTQIYHDITLYAKYENEYIVSFDTNGGTPIESVVVSKGEKVNRPDDPRKGDAEFAGWYKNKDLTEEYDFNSPVTESMILYAKWIERHIVTLYSPGANPNQQFIKVKHGETITGVTNPTMSGYVFKGWHYSQIFPIEEEPVNLNNTPIVEDLFLFASWDKDIPKNTVVFKYEDGVTPDLEIEVADGGYVEQPADPIKKDAYFDGWMTEQGGTVPFNFDEPINEDTTLYARYLDEGIRVVLESSNTLQFKYPTYSGDKFTVQVVLNNSLDSNFYYVPKSAPYYEVTTSNGRVYSNYSFDVSGVPTLTIDLTNQTSVVHAKTGDAICKYMSFTGASDDDNFVTFNPDELRRGGGHLEYNKNLSEDGWQEWTGGSGTSPGKLHLTNGETYYVRGTNDKLGGEKNNFLFRMNGKIKADGDITSLRNFSTTIRSYDGLFTDARELITPPQLPLTNLGDESYIALFNNCSSLKKVPVLPATNFGENVYDKMFFGCESLKKAPLLPATVLTNQCYRSMFAGCHNLIKATPLLANDLAEGCYDSMFAGCHSLINEPTINATKVGRHACTSMFSNCWSLHFANDLLATELGEYCYSFMFHKCYSLLKAPKLSAATNQLKPSCYEGMFCDCTKLGNIEVAFDEGGFTQDSEGRYLYTADWIEGVKAIGSFKWKGKNDYSNFTNSTIHEGWYIVHID